MPRLSKKVLMPAAAIAVATGVAITAAQVSAQSPQGDYPTVVQRLVEQFGLNEAEVKAVFEEAREEHMAEREAEHESRLDEAVAAGIITEEQRQLLINKHQEMREAGQERRQEAREERQENRETRRAEMESWAEANGIDLEALHEFMFDSDEPVRHGRPF